MYVSSKMFHILPGGMKIKNTTFNFNLSRMKAPFPDILFFYVFLSRKA